MSYCIDTNIWVYALDSRGQRFKAARAFIDKKLDEADECVICWPVIYEVLRVITHPALVGDLAAADAAAREFLRFIDETGIRVVFETEEHRRYIDLVVEGAGVVRGNFWHDCHIAAILLEHGVGTIYTCDRDFRKIRHIKAINPLE